MGLRHDSAVREVVRGGEPRFVIDFRYRDQEGQQRRYRRDAPVQLLDAAVAEARRLKLRAVSTGSVESHTPALFQDFAMGPFTYRYIKKKCRPSTRSRYQALFHHGILEAFGSMRLDEIGATELAAYAAALAKRGVQSRPHLSLVRTVLRVAVQWGELAKLPALPKLPSAPRKLEPAPSIEDVENLLSRATDWLRVAIALAAYGGLAVGEICGLQVVDVNLDEGHLNVRRTFCATKKKLLPSHKPRIVRLAPELKGVLVKVARGADTSRVVRNEARRTPRRQSVLAELKRLQKKYGLRQHSFQALRRLQAQLASARHGKADERQP